MDTYRTVDLRDCDQSDIDDIKSHYMTRTIANAAGKNSNSSNCSTVSSVCCNKTCKVFTALSVVLSGVQSLNANSRLTLDSKEKSKGQTNSKTRSFQNSNSNLEF